MPYLDLDGTAINFRDVGAGPPVVLLHSSSSHSGQWRQLSDSISDRFRVLAPDLHGYGGSDALAQDGRPYTQQDTAIVSELLGLAVSDRGRPKAMTTRWGEVAASLRRSSRCDQRTPAGNEEPSLLG